MFRLIAFTLLVGAFANECSPGYKHKKDLTSLKCIGLATDAKSCNAECCEADKAKCGGLTPTCAWDSYLDTTAAGKNTAATEKTKNTNCCKKKATCSAVTCPAGLKKKSTAAKTLCASDAASCALNTLCCEDDPTTCLHAPGGVKTCQGTHVLYNTAGNAASDGWQKTIFGTGQTNFRAKCCTVKAHCDKATCPAGQKKISPNPQNTVCKDKLNADSADVKDCSRDQLGDAAAVVGPPAVAQKFDNPCCIANQATCGGASAEKTATKVVGLARTCTVAGQTFSGKGAAWNGKATGASQANFNTNCCTKVATCKQATCPSGYVKNTGNDAVACTGDAASCATATCCKLNTKTCGGLKSSGIVCKYGFFDESEFWTTKTTKAVKDEWNNKAANSTNKNTNCCTLREACRVPTGTTTPAAVAAVVTTTPAAPALKFSEHKVAVEEGSDRSVGSNMVWLGVGGVIGMGVLMVVQGLRSKRTVAPRAEGEDADALLNSLE